MPVVPLVYDEVVADSWHYWVGIFSSCEIKEAFSVNFTTNPVYLKADSFCEKLEMLEDLDLLTGDESDSEIEEKYEKLSWQKYIIVYIELP